MEGSSWEKVSTAWNGEEFLGTKRLCIPQIYISTYSEYVLRHPNKLCCFAYGQVPYVGENVAWAYSCSWLRSRRYSRRTSSMDSGPVY